MFIVYSFVFAALFVGCGFLGFLLIKERIEARENGREYERRLTQGDAALQAARRDRARLIERNEVLEKWADVEDAQSALDELQEEQKSLRTELQNARDEAVRAADEVIRAAERRAKDIAGDAYTAMEKADLYDRTAIAMKNIVHGYGPQYLVPPQSLLDDLADGYGHTEAGRALKEARKAVRAYAKSDSASDCDYVDKARREDAKRFVLDAFNGKVEAILSRVRHDNAGTLEQKVRDAYAVVNHSGRPFRNARILVVYLEARLEELKWASIVQLLKEKEREEQRELKERIREEKRAQREFEKARKQAEKEERAIQRAMREAEARMAQASEAQRAEFEGQLEELRVQLAAAESKNERALSMAQQTRRGHVYIISNAGSFGENVYKIGVTRRLEPLDRVKELGDASVPFPFDVHAMIMSEDAPALEKTLHDQFALSRVNKVNRRKEFFRASIADIRAELETLECETSWTMAAEAREYQESQAIDRMIEDDPAAREAWLAREFAMPADYEPEEGDSDEG